MLHGAHVVKVSQRGAEGAGDIHEQLDAEVHLEVGVALRDAFLKRAAHVAAAAFAVGVAIDADAVAELAAKQLPNGNAPELAGDIPASQLDGADTARLAGVTAELADATEHLLDIQRVFAENAALQHRGVCAGGGVSDLAISDKALLVGIKFY